MRTKDASVAATHRPRVVWLERIAPAMVAAIWMSELIELGRWTRPTIQLWCKKPVFVSVLEPQLNTARPNPCGVALWCIEDDRLGAFDALTRPSRLLSQRLADCGWSAQPRNQGSHSSPTRGTARHLPIVTVASVLTIWRQETENFVEF